MLRPVNRFVISTSTEVPLWNLQPSQMSPRKIFHLKLRSGTFTLGKRTLVMGVLNVTPDSFSDGGKFFDAKRAVQHALAMQSDGADIVDVGAESTRPGSQEISVAEELSRLLPVLEQLRGKLKIPISVDTQKATVAEMALGAGAEIVNDISGLRTDPEVARIVARRGAALILMHMRGTPRTMQKGPFARDVMRDVIAGLKQSIATAKKYGVPSSQMVIDPGIGFGKNYAQNYELLAKLPKLATLGYPLMVGTSRKGFLGATLAKNGKPAPAEERIWGTAATVAASILNGGLRGSTRTPAKKRAQLALRSLWNSVGEPRLIGAVSFEKRGTAQSASFGKNCNDHTCREPDTDHKSPKAPHERSDNSGADAGSNREDRFRSRFSLRIRARKMIQTGFISAEFQNGSSGPITQ